MRDRRRVVSWLAPLLTAVGMLALAAGLGLLGLWTVLAGFGPLHPITLGSFLMAGLLVLLTGHVTLLVYETFADR